MTHTEMDRIIDLHYAGESAKYVAATVATVTNDCVHEVAGGAGPRVATRRSQHSTAVCSLNYTAQLTRAAA